MTQQRNDERLERELGQFKEVANYFTRDISVDERMVYQVRAKINEQPAKRPRKTFMAYMAAAACLLVMLISGIYVLTPYIQGQQSPGGQLNFNNPPDNTGTPHSVSSEGSSFTSTGELLPYSIEEIYDYFEGYAVAKASNGYYGYVNQDGLWVKPAIYQEAWPVQDGQADVTAISGEKSIISLSE